MINLPNYQIIQLIYESTNSLVYRGVRKPDNQPVILKMLKPDYPTAAELTRYQQEYEILNHFNFDGIIKTYGIEKYQNTRVLILEDFGGESLKQLRAEYPVTMPKFLPLAIQIADSLGNIHAAHLIHKDINPSNIVFNANTQQLKIIDFGIASRIPHEKPTLINPQHLEGTLAYISPEQTGRINRNVDYRTDFYSLGVTFYELLTGQVPFQSSDSLELVHCHLAKTPTSVHELNSEVPAIISELVMKLMAKNVDERYQSAFGVKTDLEKCLENLEGFENLQGLSFELAQHDFSGQFNLPQKLYGRDTEINTLLQAFERVTNSSQSQLELMLVAGYSGVGKTALVHEVHKPMTSRCGYFAAGKFDQYQRNIPYSAFTQAFSEFCHYLLTETAEQLAYWRQTILTAVGKNGQVLIDIIPALEWVIGKQPAVAQVGQQKAQNRFNLVFQSFMHSICQPTHPLVLFIDDWQWADPASLSLLNTLMTDTDNGHLLLIGAYRDNEVDAAHPFRLTVEELKKANTIVNTICVPNLSSADVNALISETLACEPAQTSPLTNLVSEKTQGNAFFTHQFLQSLYEQQLLVFDWQTQKWHWEVDKIAALDMTNNVVELMAGKISQLAAQTHDILKLAACIGNQFDLNTLSIISQQQPQDTLTHLWQAIEESLLVPLNDNYKLLDNQEKRATASHFKFQHDRIQQAAYSLIANSDKKSIHLQIGRLLLANSPEEQLDKRIFDIVNQLNEGRELIEESTEKLNLAKLNLMAGKKAKVSAAHIPAFKYFKIGMELLEEDSWQTQYELTLALYEQATEAAYLNTDFEETERLAKVVLQHAKTVLDTVTVYEVKINVCIAKNQQLEAVKTKLAILKLLGISFPEQPSFSDIQQGLEETRINLGDKPIEDLSNLPEMTEPIKLAAMRVLSSAFVQVINTIPELMPLMVFQQINLSLKYGNAPSSAFAYANYGFLLCQIVENIEVGFRFSKLAMQVLERFQAIEFKARILVTDNYFLKPWKEHVRNTLKPLQEAYQSGFSTGDFEFASYSIGDYVLHLYFSGKELVTLEQEMVSISSVMEQLKQKHSCRYNEIFRQTVLNLIGRTENLCLLRDVTYNEETMLQRIKQENDRFAIFCLSFNKLVLCYLFGKYHQALENTVIAEQYLDTTVRSILLALFHFYDSLVRLAVFPEVPNSAEQEDLIKKVTANQEKMQNWAHHAPMNFLHKFYLVEAERARVLDKDGDAREYYDKAIALAQEHEYLNEEALAHELAGKFYLAKELTQFAKVCLRNAHYAYQCWGAIAKVKDLETRYPQWLGAKIPKMANVNGLETIMALESSTSDSTATTQLDLHSVMKAAQTLSGEIVLSRLLEKMMYIVIENAGAEKGFLLLAQNDNWFIEAAGHVDCLCVTILQSLALEASQELVAVSLIHYVIRTQKQVVLNNACKEGNFTRDPYMIQSQAKSVLCVPLLNQGQMTGVLYLENNQMEDAFSSERVEVLNLLSSQLAISIENARLYQNLEQKVTERTQELSNTLSHLKSAQAQLIEAEKMASLGGLVAGVAHEINTPLGIGVTAASTLADKTEKTVTAYENKQLKGSALKAYFETALRSSRLILNNLERAGNLVQNFKQVAVDQTHLDKRTFAVKKYIEDSLVNLTPYLKRTSHQITVTGDDTLSIESYPGAFSQIITNLVMNSLTHAYQPGEAGHFQFDLRQESERLILTYSDDGCGIATDNLDKIFEPFFTTNRVQGGTGLGLHIVYNLVMQKLQGSIHCQSEVGIGTTFLIELPL